MASDKKVYPPETKIVDIRDALSFRAYATLTNGWRGKDITVGHVRGIPDSVLLRVPNFGRKTLKLVRDVLGSYEEADHG